MKAMSVSGSASPARTQNPAIAQVNGDVFLAACAITWLLVMTKYCERPANLTMAPEPVSSTGLRFAGPVAFALLDGIDRNHGRQHVPDNRFEAFAHLQQRIAADGALSSAAERRERIA